MATTSPNQTKSSLPLQDRVAIVTGSSRGIGKAIAIYLASLGAKLVINYVSNKEQADAVADEINSSWNVSDKNPRAIVVQADVSEPSHVKLLFDEAERIFVSEVHVLVNNAAVVSPSCPIADTDVNEFDRTFRYLFISEFEFLIPFFFLFSFPLF